MILAVQVNLKEQGQLIRQDAFLLTFRKKKCQRHIFLFRDLILFSKTRKTDVGNDTYIYKQSFKVNHFWHNNHKPLVKTLMATHIFVILIIILISFFRWCCNCILVHLLCLRHQTLAWLIILVTVGCVLKSGFEEGSHRTHTYFRHKVEKWRRIGQET